MTPVAISRCIVGMENRRFDGLCSINEMKTIYKMKNAVKRAHLLSKFKLIGLEFKWKLKANHSKRRRLTVDDYRSSSVQGTRRRAIPLIRRTATSNTTYVIANKRGVCYLLSIRGIGRNVGRTNKNAMHIMHEYNGMEILMLKYEKGNARSNHIPETGHGQQFRKLQQDFHRHYLILSNSHQSCTFLHSKRWKSCCWKNEFHLLTARRAWLKIYATWWRLFRRSGPLILHTHIHCITCDLSNSLPQQAE